jgi:CheY-like chemotaxis protein
MAKVLVVDDNVETARALALLLKFHRHEVGTAYSGEEALERIQAEDPPELVLLDFMMPGMDGGEVLRRVRQQPRLNRVRVVVFSALNDPAVRDYLLARGAQGFWTKASFDYHNLATEVDRVLGATV